jgi:hypothetical protein
MAKDKPAEAQQEAPEKIKTKRVRILAAAQLPRWGAESIEDVVELPEDIADALIYGGAAIPAEEEEAEGRKADGRAAERATSKRAARAEAATTD